MYMAGESRNSNLHSAQTGSGMPRLSGCCTLAAEVRVAGVDATLPVQVPWYPHHLKLSHSSSQACMSWHPTTHAQARPHKHHPSDNTSTTNSG